MRKLLRRLVYWIRRRRMDQELAEEIEFHRAMKQESFEQSGLAYEHARTESRRAMGNVFNAREDGRCVWISVWLDQLERDIRYGLRQLRRSPGFTVIAVVTLAIGIGANSAVFTLVDGVLLEALPYKDASQLVLISEQLPNAPAKFGVSPPDFEFLRNQAESFSGMAAYSTASYELSEVTQPERLRGARVSSELFSVLGITPALGRALTSQDDREGSHVAILSHGLWSRSYGQDQAIIGRDILLDGHPYTVVGIMPRAFDFPPRGPQLNGEPAEVFIPMSFSAFERQAYGMLYANSVVGRLKPGISIEKARAEMTTLLKRLVAQYPAVIAPFASGLSIPIAPFNEEVVGRSRRMLLVLMGAVAMVLLISCADVANLILTSSSSRQREIAIRSSLGAGPRRIAQQLVTETITLAGAGGVLGFLLASFSMKALLSLAGDSLPRAESVAMNYRVVVFTAIVALATPIVFALLPALRSAFANDAEALKNSTTRATHGRSRSRMLGSFVVAQVALALVVSVGAGLLAHSFIRLLSTDPGFRPEQVVSLRTTLPSGRYARAREIKAFYRRATEAAQRIPGVVAVGAGNDLPLGVRDRRAFSAEGNTRPILEPSRLIAPTWISGDYFQVLGIPLKRGRMFTDADAADVRQVVIINEALARMLWPDADPIGHHIKWGIEVSQAPWMTIVGVVGDVKESALQEPAMAQVYVPFLQQPLDQGVLSFFRTLNVVVRSPQNSESLGAELRTAIRQIDPELPVHVQPVSDMIGDSLKPQRFSTTVVMLFAIVAVALAAIGIFGVLANAVAQQKHEIGVRMALGARSTDIVWMILRRALCFTAVGVAIGIAGALSLTHLMSGLLYEVRPTDAAAYLGSSVLLALIAILASLVPAWRATRLDPLTVLKVE